MTGQTVPTIRLKHKTTGDVITVNELDYANGDVPGANMNLELSLYERVSETHGDGKAADDEAEAQRLLNVKLRAEAEAKENAEAARLKHEADAALATKNAVAAAKAETKK